MPACPFCETDRELLLDTPGVIAFPDAYPVTDGHTLVCPRRHVARVFDLDDAEWAELWTAVRTVQRLLAARVDADGWNVGVNAGAAAGQTVPHAHVHVIPRRAGDVPDPRGGVRAVIAGRAVYWSPR
jgi:diadenosine tetraphosphate (Ap4A) HIT family hydrolase